MFIVERTMVTVSQCTRITEVTGSSAQSLVHDVVFQNNYELREQLESDTQRIPQWVSTRPCYAM